MPFKSSILIITALLLCLSTTSCTKKAVRPDSISPNQSMAQTGDNGGGINLVTSAKNLVSGIFTAFGKGKKTALNFKFTKNNAITAMVIGAAVLVGLLVLFQNRPKKYTAPKGKYQA